MLYLKPGFHIQLSLVDIIYKNASEFLRGIPKRSLPFTSLEPVFSKKRFWWLPNVFAMSTSCQNGLPGSLLKLQLLDFFHLSWSLDCWGYFFSYGKLWPWFFRWTVELHDPWNTGEFLQESSVLILRLLLCWGFYGMLVGHQQTCL